jgi:hypothetical protein
MVMRSPDPMAAVAQLEAPPEPPEHREALAPWILAHPQVVTALGRELAEAESEDSPLLKGVTYDPPKEEQDVTLEAWISMASMV